MAFRWKSTPADQQAFLSQEASRQMAGYTPTPANGMQGYRPNVASSTPFNNEQLAEQNYNQFNAELQTKRQQLEQLKMQLAEIDKQIATVEAGGADDEKAIAAKLAEIGDTSLYQGIINREQNSASQQKSNATGISNLLFEADTLSYGLDSKSEEDKNLARNGIRVALEKAKYMAEQSGTQLPDKYYELKARLEEGKSKDSESIPGSNVETLLQMGNTLSQKARTKVLSDKDLQPLSDYLADPSNRNTQRFKEVEDLYNKYKGLTVEAKARYQKEEKEYQDLARSLANAPDALRRWNALPLEKRKGLISRGYKMDTKGHVTRNGGLF